MNTIDITNMSDADLDSLLASATDVAVNTTDITDMTDTELDSFLAGSTILPAKCPARIAAEKLHDGSADSFDALQEAYDAIRPEVGMGATWYGYTDRTACTIVEVLKNGREIVLREDHSKLLNGVNSGAADALEFEPGGFCGHTSGTQRWAYRSNPEGELYRFSLRNVCGRPRWVAVGQRATGGRTAIIGIRANHYDYNF